MRALKIIGGNRHRRAVTVAGIAGFCVTAAIAAVVDAYAGQLGPLAIALAALSGALSGMLIVGAALAARMRRKLSEQNMRLDAALNNMVQGLCMFDAQSRLVVWNERYRAMYNIEARRIHPGCTVADLLAARIAAGTFPLDPTSYDADLQAHLKQGKAFTLIVELADGRIVAVVNQPMDNGGWVAMHEDITERKQAERALEHTRAFLDTVIENVPSPILVKDVPGLRYSLINRAAEKYLGVSRTTMLGRTSAEVLPKASVAAIAAEDQKMLASGEPVFLDEHAILTPSNGTRIVTAARLPARGPTGKLDYLITVINDVTDRKRSEQQLAHMAHHDALTDLPNRAAFNDCLSATVDLAGRSGESFAVLSIDLDQFKEVNDVFGQAVGDDVLRNVALRIQEAGQGAFLARVAGDEFAVITPTGPQPSSAETIADRLARMFDRDIDVNGRAVRIGLTIGIALFPQDGKDAAALVANADAALFRAKAEARGSIRFFESAMDCELREKRALQQDLRSALANGEIELHYQPQARIAGEVFGFEALVRWNHPQRGLVPPSTFIPLAEESGMIMALGDWILRTACREAASWPRPLGIAVNLSPVQFEHGDLPRLLHEILIETGLAPARLELEITEGVLIGDFNRAVTILRRLKALGVRIAMDDFGTGYSSLSYLQSFPFDKIKIDRAFVANLGSEQAAAIIRAVIALGRGLDLPVIAEGVETEQQVKFLASEGCDQIQGYLIGRPKPIADYAHMVGRAVLPPRKIKTPRLKAVS